MKKILTLILIVFPLSASAVWWNPFTWNQDDRTGLPVLTVPQGGTGASSFPVGECIKGNGTAALTSGSCNAGGGGDFPFTVNAGYNSTSTVIGFLQGIFSTASSTFSGAFRLSALSDGGLAVYNGLVSSGATTTAGTGLTYSGNAFNVNTTQNIAKLSNLPSNGFVKTSGGDGTLSVDTTTYESGLTAGDGLTRTVNDFDCDTANGSTFGCLSSTDWTTFNSKLGSYDAFTHPAAGYSATTSSLIIATSTGSTLAKLTVASTTAWSDGAGIAQWLVRNAGGNMYFATTTVDGTSTSTLSAVSILGSSGRFGIATDTPQSLFTVNQPTTNAGIATLSGSASAVAPYLTLQSTGAFAGSQPAIQWTNPAGNLTTARISSAPGSSFADSKLIFEVANPAKTLTEAARFNTYGFLGISTTTPQWQLQIATTSANGGFRPQLTLTDMTGTTNQKHWNLSSLGGMFFISTSTDGFATSSVSALSIDANGKVRANCFTTDGSTCISGGGLSSYDAFTHPVAGQSATTSLMLFNGNASSTGFSANYGYFNYIFASTTATSTIQGKLVIGSSTPALARSFLTITGNETSYIQANLQNTNTGSDASSAWVVTADNGNDRSYYGEYGINNSKYTTAAFNSQNAGDVFMHASDGGLVLGTASSTNPFADLRFVSGGTASSSIRMVFNYKGYGMIGTTTETKIANMTIASSTASQLSLSAGTAGIAQWILRNAGGNFYLGTTTAQGAATSTIPAMGITTAGTFWIGTTTPPSERAPAKFNVSSSTQAQIALFGGLTDDYWAFRNAGGNLYFSTSTTANTSTSSLPFLALIGATGRLGISSSTPFSGLSVGTGLGAASSSITVAEYRYGKTGNFATSTTATIDCRTTNQHNWPIGTSATTLTLTGLTPGQKCIVVVENPNGTAGAITWAVPSGYTLRWAGGTVPTQTTTANKMDVWSFLVTQGSTTISVLGAQNSNF